MTPTPTRDFALGVSSSTHSIDGRNGNAVLINGQLPAPLLRWREGESVTLRVTNHLQHHTSIHWHGLLLPADMDGVPGVSFPGISPNSTFTYHFPVRQAGTYWYHSHSGLQEQLGHYGPIIIDPAASDPTAYDREHVVLLSDWTFEDPHRLFGRLKKADAPYNYQRRTLGEFQDAAAKQGFRSAFAERLQWGAMRMDPTDIADVTGATYTYLVNGHSPAENWTGLYAQGERVRLRFINASAMSIFNVRIPGLPMEVVQADGQDVQPIETDELQIGTAETFDVVVRPPGNVAYTIMAESNDRSGFARATLAPKEGMHAPVPPLRSRPTLTMKDMGMAHANSDHSHHAKPVEHNHPRGPGVAGVAVNPTNRLSERPLGLEAAPHRVLVYSELKSLRQNPDRRPPDRELELHLTSNMQRYMWSFDGVKYSDVDGPIVFGEGERLRLNLVNDTMMPHPIHLHGMFFELLTGDGTHNVRKHTVVVKPGERLSMDVTADALGDWAFHCHLLYHMHAGMMRVVSVRQRSA